MRPVSQAEYAAATTRTAMPEPELIAESLWTLPMPMPSGGLQYTLTVVHVGPVGDVTIVDPGWNAEGGLGLIEQFLAGLERDLSDVKSIIVTHAHPDHIGLAGELRQASGAQVLMHPREQQSMRAGAEVTLSARIDELRGWGLAPAAIEKMRTYVEDAEEIESGEGASIDADLLVEDGELLPIDGARWRVLHTPGHTPGHICLVDEERQLLFSGDHLLPTVFPGLGLGAALGENPIGVYLHSLQRLAPFDEFEIVPGHGYRFHGLQGRRIKTAEHVLRRAREVAAVIRVEPHLSVWDVAARLTWKGGWNTLTNPFMLYSAVMQTAMYRDFVASGGLEEFPSAR